MYAAPDIVRRLLLPCLVRRLPLWLAGLLPWLVLRSVAGAMTWLLFVAVDAWRLRRRVARQWPHWLDNALPDMEDSSALLLHAETTVGRLQQARLKQRIGAALDGVASRHVARSHVGYGLGWSALSAALALTFWLGMQPRTQEQAMPNLQGPAPIGTLSVSVTPPPYTGVAPSEGAPRDLQVPEQSVVRWCLNGAAAGVVELSDGQELRPGKECATWTANESMFWRWHGARYVMRVQPDLPPEITLQAPSEMTQTLARDARTARIALHIKDDYRIERAAIHLTLARGSGENIRFSDKEIPIPSGADPRLRQWDKQWSLSELGMEPGDELYFFVRAIDNAGKPHQVQSPTYTLRLPGPKSTEIESTALPTLAKPENLRSQRQIIIDTEQLLADMRANPKLAPAVVRTRSETIARDQALLKRRYGQFLGEESSLFGDGDDDEGPGHGGDILHQFGHAHDNSENATLFDEGTKKILRRALAAMWDAERELRAITPKAALPHEYKALEAIKELQQADRIYLHKTAFAPPAIKEDKRMTGELTGAKSFQRPQSDLSDPVPAELRELIANLNAEGPLPADWRHVALDAIRAHLSRDDQRLAAQRAVQDVADGCQPCRSSLRAWLRMSSGDGQVRLQARSTASSPFASAFDGNGGHQ